MFKKSLRKSMSVLLCVMIFISLIPNIALSADQERPIFNGMESTGGITAPAGGTVSLSTDKVSGDFAVKVTAGDSPVDRVSYNLANSNSFEVSKFSQVKVWVKPGAGAKWIEFYVRDNINNLDSLVRNDKDADCRFEVGEDLISGQWNEVTLDLTKTSNPSMTQAANLGVNTNDLSTWIYDEVSTVYTPTQSVDITKMKDSKTQLVNGVLQLTPNAEGKFSGPTVVVSGNSSDSVTNETTQAQFQQGILTNVTATSAGDLELQTGQLTGTRESPPLNISINSAVTGSRIDWDKTDSTVSTTNAVFSRSSIAYNLNNLKSQVASGVRRHEASYSNLLTDNQASVETDTGSINGWASDGGVSLSKDSSLCWTGSSSTKLTRTNSIGQYMSIYMDAAVNSGSIYSASIYARTNTTKIVSYRIEWINPSGGCVGYSTGDVISSSTPNTWVRVKVENVTAPTGATVARIVLWLNNATYGDYLWCDGAQFEQSANVHPWILPSQPKTGLLIEDGTANLLTADQSNIELSTPTIPAGFASIGATLTRDTNASVAYEGNKSFKIVSGGGLYNGIDLRSDLGVPFTVIPGETYTFSTHMKGSVGGETVTLSCFNGNGTVTLSDQYIVLSNNWKRYEATFTIPDGV